MQGHLNLTRHIIIGDGRLAKHWLNYLSHLAQVQPQKQFQINSWARKAFNSATQADVSLANLLDQADYAWVLIKDQAIAELIGRFKNKRVQWIHCSGTMQIDGVWDIHPLMTFGTRLYENNYYSEIPLVTSQPEAQSFLAQNLPNPVRLISAESKPLYHALCVLMGNGIQTILNSTPQALAKIGLPIGDFKMLIDFSVANSISNGILGQTGPWVRGDSDTIKTNKLALEQFQLNNIYTCLEEQAKTNIK